MEEVKGFKVFNPDWTCRGYQYAVGMTAETDAEIEVCEWGFHFCENPAACFNYYSFDPRNKVAEVIARGKVKTEGDKSVTDKLEIVREVSWEEVLRLVNTGTGCSGLSNSGNRNSGNRNSGNRNSGNRNSGNRNSGDFNSGNRNSGNFNSGDFNKTDCSNGCFCTEEPKIYLFNKPSDMTLRQWWDNRARYVMLHLPEKNTLEWVDSAYMSGKEKEEHPEHETTGGFLRAMSPKETAQHWWKSLGKEDKEAVLSLPNFDAEIFREITGIKV